MSNMKDISSENDEENAKESSNLKIKPKEIPRHPKWCPDCLGKGQRSQVKIFNLNEEREAIYMCSNMQVRQYVKEFKLCGNVSKIIIWK